MSDNIMLPIPCRVHQIIRETEAEFTFRILYQGIMPKDGQFFQLSIPKVGEAPISVSGRGDGYVEFTIRKVGRLTEGVFNLREGNLLYMRGPYGTSWPTKELENHDLIVVTSGTGMAPVRTLLKHFADHPKIRKEVYLVGGFKDRNSTLFEDDRRYFDTCFHTVYPLSREKEVLPGYAFGRVTSFLLEIPVEEMCDCSIVITGAPAVIASSAQHFLERGVNPERIWVSLERKMSCAVGKCGHCKMNSTYVCLEGPVFPYTRASQLFD